MVSDVQTSRFSEISETLKMEQHKEPCVLAFAGVGRLHPLNTTPFQLAFIASPRRESYFSINISACTLSRKMSF